MEAALPHVLLAISAVDQLRAREEIERILGARHVSYGVQEADGRLRLAAALCEPDYAYVRREIGKSEILAVISEGREPTIGGLERLPLRDSESCDGGRILKLTILLAGR
jgi:hypothetical protein